MKGIRVSRKNGQRLFHKGRYFSFPYSLAERREIFRLVSLRSFVRYPEKWESIRGFLKAERLASVGSRAPDFTLLDSEGRSRSLAEFRGRYVAFMFVAMTCPPARIQTEAWTRLFTRYDRHDVQPLLIYSRERHPGDPGYLEFEHPDSYEQKAAYARMHARLTDIPVLVDTFDQEVLSLYGKVPNQCVVVNRAGCVAFKSGWASAPELEYVLDSLLEYENTISCTIE